MTLRSLRNDSDSVALARPEADLGRARLLDDAVAVVQCTDAALHRYVAPEGPDASQLVSHATQLVDAITPGTGLLPPLTATEVSRASLDNNFGPVIPVADVKNRRPSTQRPKATQPISTRMARPAQPRAMAKVSSRHGAGAPPRASANSAAPPTWLSIRATPSPRASSLALSTADRAISTRAHRVADARFMPEPSFRHLLRAGRRSAKLAVDVDARGRPAITAVALLAAVVVVLLLWWLS